jgi:ethanolamine utilization microcompartment shell protein EutS
MNTEITIKAELLNKGRWIKVNIPASKPAATAIVSSAEGEVLKKVMLEEGNNAIDISSISNNSINIKVETANETILKNIKLIHQ